MSRGKLRGTVEVCADCGIADPTWASVNRGILICDECCSVHRSLGRHISQVKSLKKGLWSPTQLAMVHTLCNNGANSIWEHSLLDPTNTKTGRRKPSVKDPIHPIKADFIRAKHQVLAFVYRPGREDNHFAERDVSKQLHSSVRTGNLETSLRLLSLGADPNYFHSEKGNCPIHVAAKAGQISQVELLVVYGADPGAYDNVGKTPVDYARMHNYFDLADRLVELQFELTDRLAYYLCGRKPDHRTGPHFIIPEMADSLDMSELAKAAKKKLQSLPNNLFEELGMDIYDEVDRRETDAIWLSTQNQSALVTDRCAVPFLPVNPEFSTTRNQGRQKLARFNAREFATLIIDFLSDAKRRQMGLPLIPLGIRERDSKENTAVLRKSPPKKAIQNNASRKADAGSDDEPLYDSVASDDESVVEKQNSTNEATSNKNQDSIHTEKTPDIIAEEGSPLAKNSISVSSCTTSPTGSLTTILSSRSDRFPTEGLTNISGGKQSVHSHDFKDPSISLEVYLDVKKQLATSHAQIQQLLLNNNSMKQEISLLQNMLQKLRNENTSLKTQVHSMNPLPNGHENAATLPHAQRSPRSSPRSSMQRPQSMYEPRDQLRQQTWPSGVHGPCSKKDETRKSPIVRKGSGDYDTLIYHENDRIENNARFSPALNLPMQSDVVKKTEQITKKIQELLISAQENKHECFIPCSEKIYGAVIEMARIFPQDPVEHVGNALRQLTMSALRLKTECRNLLAPAPSNPVDYRFVTQQVIQCAYDIAKAAKQLVTIFQ